MTDDTFTAAETDAIRTAARERRSRPKRKPGDDLAAAEAAIAALSGDDHTIAAGVHATVTCRTALQPRTWYGMPAYADEHGVVCFLQPASKFSTRYATLGFTDRATLDDTTLWATAYALTAWDDRTAATVTALVERATAIR